MTHVPHRSQGSPELISSNNFFLAKKNCPRKPELLYDCYCLNQSRKETSELQGSLGPVQISKPSVMASQQTNCKSCDSIPPARVTCCVHRESNGRNRKINFATGLNRFKTFMATMMNVEARSYLSLLHCTAHVQTQKA